MMRLSGFVTAVRIAPALLAVFVLAGCSSDGENEIETQSAEEIYARGQEEFETDLIIAASTFEELERIHPYSPLAKQAMIRAADAYYIAGKFDQAVAASNRFLQLYPGDDLAPRAQFLMALSQYDRIPDVGRDQSFSRGAEQELLTLIQRYPDSRYSRDAQLMLEATRHQLAGQEMEIGRYYLKRGHYLSAVQRFRNVISDYPKTEHVAEALHRLVEANLSLGLIEEARRAGAILGYNFPGSGWYQESYALLEGVSG